MSGRHASYECCQGMSHFEAWGVCACVCVKSRCAGMQTPFAHVPMCAHAQVASSTNASSANASNHSSRRNAFAVPNKVDPFDDVKLGQLLGTGSYGRVYRGAHTSPANPFHAMHSIKPCQGRCVCQDTCVCRGSRGAKIDVYVCA